MSQIRTISPPTRIFTSERLAAPALPKSRKLGTTARLPSPRRIHVTGASDLPANSTFPPQGPSRRPLYTAGVSCVLMASEGRTARGAPAAHGPPARPPIARPGDSEPWPPPTREPMSYPYTTDLASIRVVVQRYAMKAGLSEARAIDLVLAVSEVAAN